MELDKKTANAWRSFLSSQEGMDGLTWILEQRPLLDTETWQKAAGFEEFHKRISDILEFEQAARSRHEEEDTLKQ